MVNLNQGALGNLFVPLPPTKREQEMIADALSDANELIESLERLVAKTRQIKQGAMQELLTGKKRLLGYAASCRYRRTDAGLIPEDWKSVTVRELASRARNAIVGGPFGSDLVSNDYVTEGVPVIRGQNMASKFISGEFVIRESSEGTRPRVESGPSG